MKNYFSIILISSAYLSNRINTVESQCIAWIYQGASHTCVKLFSGYAKCWGAGTLGRLGYGDSNNRGDASNEMGTNLPFVDFGVGRKVVKMGLGEKQTCGILDNQTLKCFGGNDSGQLGYEDTADRGDGPNEMGSFLNPVNLGTSAVPTYVVGGKYHTCVIINSSSVKCFGGNSSGQLGYGDTATRGNAPGTMGDSLPFVSLGSSVQASSIDAGELHTCVLTQTKSVKCWGSSAYGQLGYGDVTTRGSGANQMGNSLPEVDLGTSRTANQLSLGSFHTCVITDISSVLCWGMGLNGRLGTGNVNNVGDGPSEMGNNLVPVNLGSFTVTYLSCGDEHCCAILNTKEVKCWGNGLFGRLGLGDNDDRGTLSTQMGNNLPVTNLGYTITSIQVAGAGTHSCALTENGYQIKCWGNGANGRLGLGNTNSLGNNQGEMGAFLPFVDICQTDSTAPTKNPTKRPTKNPLIATNPTTSPLITSAPTRNPQTKPPTKNPTSNPLKQPTKAPTNNPQVQAPSRSPVSKTPTTSPTLRCLYTLKVECKQDIQCKWNRKKKQCVPLVPCSKLKVKKCKKNKNRCVIVQGICTDK